MPGETCLIDGAPPAESRVSKSCPRTSQRSITSPCLIFHSQRVAALATRDPTAEFSLKFQQASLVEEPGIGGKPSISPSPGWTLLDHLKW